MDEIPVLLEGQRSTVLQRRVSGGKKVHVWSRDLEWRKKSG